MAFPFGPLPALGAFIENAIDNYGAELVTLSYRVMGPSGEANPRMLKRIVNDVEYHVMLPDSRNDVLLGWHEVRHLCDRLLIPTMDYDFVLTDEGLKPRKD